MIEVLTTGLISSIQDKGRFGFKHFGVPVSGAMDQYAMQLGNQLLNNELNAAVLEFALSEPRLMFHTPTLIVLTGGAFEATVNGEKIMQNKPHLITANSQLEIGATKGGTYGYLAVKGGFQTPLVMNSRSQYKPITETATLVKGQQLNTLKNLPDTVEQNAQIKWSGSYFTSTQLPILKAPEFEELSAENQKKILSANHKISHTISRMGYRLEGNTIGLPEIKTNPVMPGTVQLTPSGQLIVLMRDAQTTGGYARIFQLTEQGINQLAQQLPGTFITFKLVEE